MSKKTLSLFASMAIGLAAAGPLQADLTATAVLTLDNLLFLDSGGNILDFDNDFVEGTVTFTSSADMDGALTGTPGYTYNEPQGGDINFNMECLSTQGDCDIIAADDLTPLIISGAQGLDYVTSDQYQVGAPIQNLPNMVDDPTGGTIFTLGADIVQVAYASLSDTVAEGTADVNNGLEANWEFTLAAADSITLAADNVTAYLEAFASGDEIDPGKAAAGISFVVTVTNLETGQILYDSAVDNPLEFNLLNETSSLNANSSNPNDATTCGNYFDLAGAGTGCGTALSSAFAVTSAVLPGETLLQLSIRSNTNVDIARVQQVPEPSILALLGLGFLGMSLSRRRRS